MSDDAAERLNRLIDAALDSQISGPDSAAGDSVMALLRLLPDEHFKLRLKTELERSQGMATTSVAQAGDTRIREGFRTVTPYIAVVDGDGLINFLKQTFHAEETLRHSLAPGQFHAEVRIGDSMLMIGSGERLRGDERTMAIHAYVEDSDAAYARAIAAGAISLGEPADRPYGERSAYVKDIYNNIWYIATRFSSNPDREGVGSLAPYLHPAEARLYIDFLQKAFSATPLAIHEHDGHVMHAAVRIGDSVLEMGEPQEPINIRSAFFMYVRDVDAVYERAVAAGAESIRPPVDQPYGHREAALRDPIGNVWYPASLLGSPAA